MPEYKFKFEDYCPICEWSSKNPSAGGVHGPCSGCGRTDATWNTMLGKPETPSPKASDSNDDLCNWRAWPRKGAGYINKFRTCRLQAIDRIVEIIIDQEDDMILLIDPDNKGAWLSHKDTRCHGNDGKYIRDNFPAIFDAAVEYYADLVASRLVANVAKGVLSPATAPPPSACYYVVAGKSITADNGWQAWCEADPDPHMRRESHTFFCRQRNPYILRGNIRPGVPSTVWFAYKSDKGSDVFVVFENMYDPDWVQKNERTLDYFGRHCMSALKDLLGYHHHIKGP